MRTAKRTNLRGRASRILPPQSPQIKTTNTVKKNNTRTKKNKCVTPDPYLSGSYAILDLDHTLINSEVCVTQNAQLRKNCDFYFRITGVYYYVFKRPGVDAYLASLFRRFKGVAVWTAAVASYAKQIIKGVFTPAQVSKLAFIWTRKHCALDSQGRSKPLSKVWKDPALGKLMGPKNTVHVDNTAEVMRYNIDQAQLVPHFFYYKLGRTGRKVYNTGDDFLFYLRNLTCEQPQMKLPEYIKKGNLLTAWWIAERGEGP